jgi:serine/threonine-protein kinase
MLTGDTIGKYRLVSRLGSGGMGEVWLAKASGYGGFTKTVVLKTLLPELASDPLFVDLLAREAKTCSTLSHPNLIEVFDFTKHDGMYLLAMEYVLGQPLNSIMKAAHERGFGLPAWFALRVAWDCCSGILCAHEQGIIHCDLSPSNVMVTYTGATKVLDFGVAHAQAHGPRTDRLKGKYSYMAPERIKTRATDRRTDIYALGVMLYLMFTGRLPFVGETDAELLYKITAEKLVCPSSVVDLEPRIEQVILRAMHADPNRRFQSVLDVQAALAPCLEGKLGTYGQQHVASFMSMLFRGQQVPTGELADLIDPVDAVDVIEEIEVDIDADYDPAPVPRRTVRDTTAPAILRPSRDTTPLPLPLPPPRAVGSDAMPPLASKPLMAAFARPLPVQEPKTSVQSLFGDRPTSTSTVATLFARGTHDDVRDEAVEAVAPPPPVASELVPEPPAATSADPRESARRLFGEYSVRPAVREVVWPWPSSSRGSGGGSGRSE